MELTRLDSTLRPLKFATVAAGKVPVSTVPANVETSVSDVLNLSAPDLVSLPPPPTDATVAPKGYPSAHHVTTMIVGGGVGGLYTGWRLAGADGSAPTTDPSSIGIFERSERLGGRIDSVAPPGMPDVKAEFGGMRYLDSQRLISSLIDKLHLKSELFQVSGQGDLAYLKGQRVPASDIAKLGQAYDLPKSEQGQSPVELWGGAIKSVVPDAPNLTADQWAKVQQTGGQTAVDEKSGEAKFTSFQNLGTTDALSPAISPQGQQFVRDGLGYDLLVNNQTNAADFMESTIHDFASNAPYRTLVNGMSDIPATLEKQFVEKGGAIHQGFDLKSFDYDKDKKTWVVHFQTSQGEETYTADNLVLAMPRRALERVAENTPLLARPEVKNLLGSVTPYPMMKILLTYHDDWWKQQGIEGGRTVSDTDLRQTYYLGSERDKEAGKTGNTNSLMLGGYLDGRAMEHWQKMLPADHYAGAPGEDATGDARWKQHEIPADMLKEVERELQAIHGDSPLPTPYSAAAQVWDGDIYGGAVNFWNKGQDPSKVSEQILSPLKAVKGYEDASLHIVGEAYAWDKDEGGQQGWVEGALQTSEKAVQLLGQHAPAWVTPQPVS